MKNFDSEESCNCKFNMCEYYNYDKNECSRYYCIKIEKNYDLI